MMIEGSGLSWAAEEEKQASQQRCNESDTIRLIDLRSKGEWNAALVNVVGNRESGVAAG